MSEYQFDLFVIGAGSGGVRAARMAATQGKKVAVAEDTYLGGTCVNVGCVPKKLYAYASHFGEDFHDAKGFGWMNNGATFEWETLKENRSTEISRLNGIYRNLLVNSGTELIEGRATVTGANEVEVNGQRYTAETILVATGGWPYVPEFPGDELVTTSNDAFDYASFPERMVVVGGGYIAVEFACIFAGLGAKVDLVYRGPLFLRGFDLDIREFIAEEVKKKGINLIFETNVESVEKSENGLKCKLTSGDTLEADQVLYATGRKAKTINLGLESAGVELKDNGAIIVDNNFQTNIPSIYALGDVIDRIQLTPVALAEAMAFLKHRFDDTPVNFSYDNIATAVFTQPNIGTVGLTEEQARENHPNLSIFKSDFKHLKHTLSGNQERTFMKLIVDVDTDKVLGIHMVGSDAGEIIQGLGVAMKMGLTKAQLDSTIGIHPTAAEEFVTMREAVS